MKAHKTRHVIAGMAVIAAAALLLTVVTGTGIAGSKDKEKEKGYIGVYMQDLDKDLREGLDLEVNKGVLINGVEKGSPAEEAGLEDGDVIIAFDGKEISSTDELRERVADTEAGQKVKIKIIRDGREKTLTLEVGEWPDDFSWHSFGDMRFDGDNMKDFGQSVRAFMFRPRLGVQAVTLNDGLAPYFKTKPGEGVLVLEVNDDSVAEAAGILAGDVIQTVGDEKVSTVDELRESVSEYEEGDEFDVVVLRKGKKQTLKATMDDSDTHLMWSGSPRVYQFDHNVHPEQFRKHFGPHAEILKDDLSDEVKQLRKELKEMKKELEELKNR